MDFMHNYNNQNVSNRQSKIDLRYYSKIMVIGVGGIGNWAAFNMALTGRTEELILIDPDDIECSNLNRTMFRVCDIGKSKVHALKHLILERRPDIKVTCYEDIFKIEHINSMHTVDRDSVCIIDCRDEIFEDIHEIPDNIKLWKIGYDGLEITVDGNPRNTKVWGEANGYEVTPSFVCSAQLAANIVVNHILMPDIYNTEQECIGGPGDKFNKSVTYHTGSMLLDMFNIESQRMNTQTEEAETCLAE
jgi:hypothetical protein